MSISVTWKKNTAKAFNRHSHHGMSQFNDGQNTRVYAHTSALTKAPPRVIRFGATLKSRVKHYVKMISKIKKIF